MDPYIAGIDSCFNAGPSHYSATRNEIDLSGFNNVRFEWNQCTDGGLFKIYIWEDDEGLPGDDIFSELQLTDNSAGWNHSIISTSGISNNGDLWVGIREYTATQAIGMDTDNEGCSVVDNGDGWEELEGGNLAYRLTTCLDDNPAGCFSTGCPDNYVCLDDWENNCVSSDCDCDEASGGWVCDDDCNGGTCFLTGCMDSEACNYNPDALVDDGSCAYELDCAGVCGGNSIEDICGICGGNATAEEHCLEFKCNMDIASYFTFGQGTSDITGYYQDGREFAAVGLVQDVAAIVDITDPENPFEVGRISGTPNIWRDLKYWNRHVYIGTEAEQGVRVVSVDDPDNPVLVYTITDFLDSHNIHIDADGYLYVIGSTEYAIMIYDLSIPDMPELVGTWNDEYLHDIEVYNNKLYGAAIYSGNFYIIDVSDKTNPTTIVTHHTGGVMTHDCAVTYNEQYLITADETSGGHIKIWDISNYDNINLVSEYMTHPEHSVHNVYVRPGTNLMIMSYYVDGTRVLDISDPVNPVEVGYFDTSDLTGLYDGNWGTYAYLPSGHIISSDRQNGLFIFESPLTNSSMEWSDCSITQGDVNYDGELNILDIVKVVNYILGTYDFTEMQYSLADMNQDAVIDILDLILLANAILNIP
ncbi:choice-of-anchor B family protein [Candidatus Marinimicrobia bacterium PRS2]|nr:choice-of-anchor B family protein [Candidatus Marinimicrobia bacterium PRS2]